MSTPSQSAPQGASKPSAGNGSHTVNDLKTRLASLPRLPLIMAAAFCVAVIVALLLWGTQPQWSVLYRDLPADEGGEIVTQLEQAGVPYRLSDQGATLEVPADQVYRLRLSMAQQGLPSQGGTGFELMDTQAFGISQFTEHVNYQRALSGELSRTIASLEPVASARVHLALPEESVFVRERRPATASVVVELHRGQQLKDRQIQAIQHLVAGSVQGLVSEDITVVDQNGEPLSRPAGDTLNLDGSALEYAQALEQRYQSRINVLLTPILGRDNFRAEVSAQLDFSHSEQTEEHYSPNQTPGTAAVRSAQLNNAGAGDMAMIGGIPGALSNTPPGTAASPINAADDTGDEGDTAASHATDEERGGNYQHSSITNYELDKVVRHTRERLGRLDKLSVAVVVNHRGVTDANGNVTSRPLDSEALEQIKALVRQAMGYSEQRGDSLSVINAPFVMAGSADVRPDDIAEWWQNPELQALAIELGRYLIILIVAWILYRKLLRPLLTPLLRPQSDYQTIGQPAGPMGEGLSAAGMEASVAAPGAGQTAPSGQEPPSRGPSTYQQNLKDARDMAREDPRLVAMILKNWMSHHE